MERKHDSLATPRAAGMAGVVFAFLGVLCAAKLERRSALVGGLLLGILVNLYFFFWTADNPAWLTDVCPGE